MKRVALFILLAVQLLAVHPGLAAEPDAPPLDAFEALVNQHVTLRSEIAAEKRAWREKEQTWNYEIQLFEKEISALRKEVDSSKESAAETLKGKAELVARKEKLERILDRFPAMLDRAEARLKTWKGRLPPPLAAPLTKAFLQLPTSASEAKRLGASRRLQVVVALYTQIESLHQNIHVTRELLKSGDSAQREMDVLYLGLARAFAVSPDNKQAAIGSPGANGWTWVPANHIAEEARKAISVFNREEPAELLTLPVSLLSINPDARRKAESE